MFKAIYTDISFNPFFYFSLFLSQWTTISSPLSINNWPFWISNNTFYIKIFIYIFNNKKLYWLHHFTSNSLSLVFYILLISTLNLILNSSLNIVKRILTHRIEIFVRHATFFSPPFLCEEFYNKITSNIFMPKNL